MENISKLKLNILKEKLYTEGLVNKFYNDIAHYGENEMDANFLIENILTEEKGKTIIEDIVDEFKLAPKFIFTFGTGIGAFYGPIQKLLEGSGVVITEYETYLLIITAIASLLKEPNVTKLVDTLKEKGVYSLLNDVSTYVTNSQKIINNVTKNVLGVTYSLSDILAFTALLVPTMNLLSTVITEYGLNSKTVGSMLSGIILSISVYGVKSIINKIKNKIS